MAQKILIVDDSVSMRQLVNFSLSEEGYEVTEGVDGLDGFEKLSAMDECSLVVTDVHMPKMNGIELVKKIRTESKFKFVPIIILTTESDDSLQKEGTVAGATAWVVKPFTPEKLLEVISKVID